MNTTMINVGASICLGSSLIEIFLNLKGKRLKARGTQFLGLAIALLGFVY